jgi:hypothetical protein
MRIGTRKALFTPADPARPLGPVSFGPPGSDRYLKAELERPVCRHVTAGPRNSNPLTKRTDDFLLYTLLPRCYQNTPHQDDLGRHPAIQERLGL